ncbi:hypothetical protein LF1_07700 [Rubripirellula obstinata]|uniref:Uncharacterized protein n=1 Tax=Rubripirellula obstinata TaxID=406547 RepID=A0A5B1CG76_9BACT|nr:hypothetical protein LF1_07700 [Rubripirellula obstinata]
MSRGKRTRKRPSGDRNDENRDGRWLKFWTAILHFAAATVKALF